MNKNVCATNLIGAKILPFLFSLDLKRFDWVSREEVFSLTRCCFPPLNLLNATPGSAAVTRERLATHCCFYLAMVFESFKQ